MELDNILLNTNISYKIISPYQKIENDKERIKTKFNFNISRTSTNSSIFKQSSMPTQKNSIIIRNKNQKIKNKLLIHNNLDIKPFRPKSTINKKIDIAKNNNSMGNNKILNGPSKATIVSRKNKSIKNPKCNLTDENNNNKQPINNNAKKKKNYIPYRTQNNNTENQIKNNNILNNITYSNYNSFINENSLTFLENQKYLIQDNISKTQPIIQGINNYNAKYNNTQNNYNNFDININNNFDNYFNLNIDGENGKATGIGNEFSESFNKSSFSGSSKTSELHEDILNIKNNTNTSANENIQIINNDNYIIKSFAGINKNVKDNKNENQFKKNEEELMEQIRPFSSDNSDRKRTEVNTMGLLDEDEYNQENRKKMLNNISKFYFIEDIIEKNNKFLSLPFAKFKNLNNKAKYKILSFTYDNYRNYLNSSMCMRNIIKDMLEERFAPCIKDFENKYKDILLIEDHQFNLHTFIKPKLKRKKFHTFCLYIKAKVLPNNEYFKKFGDISFELSYKYKIKSSKNEYNIIKSNRTNISSNSYVSKDHIQEEYLQIYQFDLRKNKNYPMWICSERDEVFNSASRNGGGINNLFTKFLISDELYQKHLIYSSPIINVNENDYIVFRIDLIENNNVIDNLSFNEPIVQSVRKNYYHKISFKQDQKFDKTRDCEHEISINVWHDAYVIKDYDKKKVNYEEFLIKLRKIFQEFFEIIDIKFDISKFLFVRMTMKAKKIGILKRNIFSNKDIQIVEKDSSLVKECTTINFVNTFSMCKNLTIKQGTIVDFYLME